MKELLNKVKERLIVLTQLANSQANGLPATQATILNDLSVEIDRLRKDLEKIDKDNNSHSQEYFGAALENTLMYIDAQLEPYFDPKLEATHRQAMFKDIFTPNNPLKKEMKKVLGMVESIQRSQELCEKMRKRIDTEFQSADDRKKEEAFQIKIQAFEELGKEQVLNIDRIVEKSKQQALASDLILADNRKKAQFLRDHFGVQDSIELKNKEKNKKDKKSSETSKTFFAALSDLFKILSNPKGKDVMSNMKSFMGSLFGFIISIFTNLFSGILGEQGAKQMGEVAKSVMPAAFKPEDNDFEEDGVHEEVKNAPAPTVNLDASAPILPALNKQRADQNPLASLVKSIFGPKKPTPGKKKKKNI